MNWREFETFSFGDNPVLAINCLRSSNHLLKDLLFDDAGHRMIATHVTKAGVQYRYYVSQPGLHGEARIAKTGSVSRVPAPEIEPAIVAALQARLAADKPKAEIKDEQTKFDRATLGSLVSRIRGPKSSSP